jgi:hypothetical protein
MEPDRFDDVESRILEGPEPPRPRPRRGRRWALALTGAALLAAGMTAGTTALGDSSAKPAARPAAAPSPHVTYDADGVPVVKSGPECHAGQGHRPARHAAAPKY